jgi:hypothetical protein
VIADHDALARHTIKQVLRQAGITVVAEAARAPRRWSSSACMIPTSS